MPKGGPLGQLTVPQGGWICGGTFSGTVCGTCWCSVVGSGPPLPVPLSPPLVSVD